MESSNRSLYKQLYPGLLLATLIFLGLLIMSDINVVGSHLRLFHWSFFVFAVALSFFNFAMRFLKRAINLQKSGVKKATLSDSLKIFVASLPLELTPARVSESVKGIWLHKITDIPVERAISIFFVDQITDSLCIFVLMILGVIAFPSLWLLFLPFLLLFIAALIYLSQKRDFVPKSTVKTKLNDFIPQWRKCTEVNPALFTIKNMTATFIIGVVSWAAEGIALFVILIGLGLPPTLPLMATAVFVFAVAATIGLATRLPGGLGVIELMMALMLTLMLDFQPEIAVLATILFRLSTFWVDFLLGLLFWSIAGKSMGIITQEGHIIES